MHAEKVVLVGDMLSRCTW